MGRDNKKQYRALWFFLWRYRAIYITLLFLTLGYAVLECVSISTFLPLLSTAFQQEGSTGRIFLFIDGVVSSLPFENRFIAICILASVVLIVKELFGFLRYALAGYGVGEITCNTKVALFNKYVNSDYQFFIENKQGKLLYNMLTATQRLSQCLQFVPDMITAILMTAMIGLLLFSISIPVTAFLLAVGLIFNIITHILAKKVSYHIGTERRDISAKSTVTSNEFIDGAKQIKTFDASNFWQNKFADIESKFKTLVIRDLLWVGLPRSLLQLLPISIFIGGIALFKIAKEPTGFLLDNLALIGVYLYAFYRLIPHLSSFGGLRMQINGRLPEIEAIYDSLHQNTNYIKDGALEIENFEREIRFEDVSFDYKDRKDILKNINLTIEKGKTTAIVGASGMGKTTLVNLLVRLFVPNKGRIMLDGIYLNEIKYSSLIKLIGLVSQDTFIFNATIGENIIFGQEDISDKELMEAAKLANAHEFIMSFPEGYETAVGDKGFKLSGGQRQRIAIARAILRKPQILILDEATSSLDHNSEASVQNAIERAVKNKTVIIIAHRLSTIMNAHKIVILEHGKIVQEGTHSDLMKQGGVYRNLYEKQDNILRELTHT